jgi:hypothetical protein
MMQRGFLVEGVQLCMHTRVRSLAVYVDDFQDIRQLGLNLHMAFQSRRHVHILYARLIHRTQAGYLDPARQGRRSGDHLV